MKLMQSRSIAPFKNQRGMLLIEGGVAPQRIRVVAHGAERPVALCEDQSCASQNRRVATIIAPANTAQLPVK